MKILLHLIAALGLATVILPPLLYLAGSIEKGPMQGWMLAGTLIWFAAAPLASRFARR